jgi:preprotein translocase subunit SecG
MTSLIIILIIITCAVLAFFVLIQNPKGGGLAGSFGGLGNQMMGAKQSTDVVEKGTWMSAAVLLVLTLGSFIMSPKTSNSVNEKTRSEKINKGVTVPQAPTPAPTPAAAPTPGQDAQSAPTQAAPAEATPTQAAPPAPAK